MAEAVDQARQDRELSKAALAARLEDFEGRVRAELDWKARLRTDGPRYAILGAITIAVITGGLLIRHLMGGSDDDAEVPVPATSNLDDVAAQLRDLRKEVAKGRRNAGAPLVQKALLRAATAAGSAAGTVAARRALAHLMPPADQEEAGVEWA